jgi:hypothetical protein
LRATVIFAINTNSTFFAEHVPGKVMEHEGASQRQTDL